MPLGVVLDAADGLCDELRATGVLPADGPPGLTVWRAMIDSSGLETGALRGCLKILGIEEKAEADL